MVTAKNAGDDQLSNKWAFVTGASRGVGSQIAIGLANAGCRLIVHGRHLTHLRRVVAELQQRSAEVHAVAAELSDPSAVDMLIDTVLAITGKGPEIVYNNAAIMTPWRDPHRTPMDDFRASFEVNVIAPTRICDRLIDPMKARGWGRLINVTSGIENIRELLPYSMSKAALDRYVRDVSPSLAGTGVILSLLDPGWLRTDLGGNQAPNPVESVLPGALVPALLPDGNPSGQLFRAQDYRST